MSIPILLYILAAIVAVLDRFGDHDVLWLAVLLICLGLLWGTIGR